MHVEFVDPHEDPKLEAEAGSRYGIRPVPFQVSGKYRSSIVNTYFDILLSYGDQYQVINFRDLIDVKVRDEQHINVELKNPEYAITSAIRKVLLSYQGGGGPFDALAAAGDLHRLHHRQHQSAHAAAAGARQALEAALAQLRPNPAASSSSYMQDPDAEQRAGGAPAAANMAFVRWSLSLLDTQAVLVLHDAQRRRARPSRCRCRIDLDQASFKSASETAVKRFSPGILKTMAVVAPSEPAEPRSSRRPSRTQTFSELRQALGNSVRWLDTDLKSGRCPTDADMLMVLDPHSLDQKQVFAIDQFLMQGGTVMIAAAPIDVSLGQSSAREPVRPGSKSGCAATD